MHFHMMTTKWPHHNLAWLKFGTWLQKGPIFWVMTYTPLGSLSSPTLFLSLSDDYCWLLGPHCHCWIPSAYCTLILTAFSGGKACFGYGSGLVVILNLSSTIDIQPICFDTGSFALCLLSSFMLWFPLFSSLCQQLNCGLNSISVCAWFASVVV